MTSSAIARPFTARSCALPMQTGLLAPHPFRPFSRRAYARQATIIGLQYPKFTDRAPDPALVRCDLVPQNGVAFGGHEGGIRSPDR
ncbi:hypothetical protein DESC_870065 [Desulfosarcina cetonica]|nr:hypothetical protein DESC_870065 [Desulfosarcina cetonica]